MAVTGKGKQIAGKSPASASSSGKRKKPAPEEDAGARRKKRRSGVLEFVDDAALDADSDYEDEDLEMEGEDLDFDFMNHGKAEKDAKGAGKSHHLPFFLKEEELSGDELEELIKDRYGRDSEYVVYGEESRDCDEDCTKDPTIWKVKCMIGREQQAVFCLMQKYVDLQNFGTRLQIISAFSLEHVKGYIYIEADKACDVTEACKGFCSIYPSRMGIVPMNEAPQLLCVRSKGCEVSKGTWVRLKSGKYKGDLAQVVAVDDERKRATVKLVPRVDLQAIAKKFGGGISLKHAPVPAPRLISSYELEDFRPHIEVRRDRQTGELFDVLDGLMLKDGYLYKKMSIASLVYWGVQPTNAELTKFTEASKGEPEDLNWVSSIYEGRKKMRCAEASDDKLAAKQGNGFDLHDLVLFGQKAFGVIIAVEKDCFQILKGDIEGPEIVKVKVQEIKNGCVDKMFTASDCHLKTISINDIVKVLEGSHQGKQGTVRHMYKGSLFIYDENQQENSGFFCAKSDLCENIKVSKDSYGANSSGKSCPLFTQSPSRSCEQQDSTRGSSRHRPSDRETTYFIGQTLRIRKGPLKGYLCRVVGMYRSDVTVKLDSLVKVMTVKEDLLSVPNLKRDDSAAMSSDLSGTREWQPIGALPDEGRGTSGDKSSWDVGVPLPARDSWQAFSTSAIAGDSDNKADRDQGTDQWGSKTTSGARDQEEKDDPWGSNAAVGARDKDQGADPWGSKAISGARDQEEKDDAWGSNAAAGPRDREQVTQPWGNKAAIGAKDDSLSKKDTDTWAKFGNSTGGQNSIWSKTTAGEKDTEEKDADGWGKASVKNSKGTDGWGKTDLPSIDAGSSWGKESSKTADQVHPSDNATAGWDRPRADDSSRNKSVAASSWEKPATSMDKGKSDTWEQPSNSTRPEVVTTNDKGSAWDMKGKSVIRDDGDIWGKPTGSKETNAKESNGWGSSCDPSSQSRANNLTPTGVDQASSWDKVKVPSGDQSDKWGKAKGGGDAGAGAWNKAGSSSQSQADEWKKPNSFGGNAVSSWNKAESEDAGANDQRDTWDKSGNFERGRGFGRGRGRDRDGGRGRGWGRGRDGSDDACGEENSWNQQRDSDGGRGSNWGRGRGRYGARGSSDQDGGGRGSMWGDSGGGWGSGRGRGRGRNGDSWGQRDDSGEARPFGRGRGRGGRFQSSDWKNDQDNSVDRSFSRNPMSSWGNDPSCGWQKSKGLGQSEEPAGNTDKQGGWSRGKSFGGEQSSNWNKDEGNNQWGVQKDLGGNQPSNWNQGLPAKDAGGAENNWNTANPSAGKQSSCWTNNEGDNWNTPKGSGSSQVSVWDSRPSGNEDAGKAAGGAGSGWDSAKPDGKQSSAWTDKRSAGNEIGKEAVGVGGSWDSPKPSGGNLSGWNSNSEKNNSVLEGLADDPSPGLKSSSAAIEGASEWKAAKTLGASNEGKDWNTSKASNSGAKQSSHWNNSDKGNWNTSRPPVGNESSGAAASSDNWNKAKPVSSAHAGEASNWNATKGFDGNKSSAWNPSSTASEASKEVDNSEGNWSRQRTYTGGSQSAGWKNDDGNGWNKPKPFGGDQSTAWNDRSGGFGGRGGGRSEGWNRGGNGGDQSTAWNDRSGGFGGRGGGRSEGWNRGGNGGNQSTAGNDRSGGYRGRGGGRSEGWNRGGNFGGDQQSGWRGDNSSRDRGRGRNFGGGRSGWNGGGDGDKGGNGSRDQADTFDGRKAFGRGQSSGWSQGGFAGRGGGDNAERGGGGWSGGGNADKGTWDGWKSEGGTGSSKGSGWNAGSGSASGPTAGGEGGWNQKTAMKGADGSKGWNTGAAKETTAGQAGGWNPRKGADGSAGWNRGVVSGKQEGSGPQEEASGISSTAGQALGWSGGGNADKGSWGGTGSSKGSGWNSGSGSASEPTAGGEGDWNQKTATNGADGSKGWNAGTAKETTAGLTEGWNPREGAGGWNSGAVSGKQEGSGPQEEASGISSTAGQALGWSQGTEIKEADGGGDKGSSWDKGAGGWGKAKDGGGGKGGGW